jgi:methyl-accepting chemotaxis protein
VPPGPATPGAGSRLSPQIEGMQSATRESVTAIEEISGTIFVISEIASSISIAVEQQNVATREIADSIQRVAIGTHDVAVNIDQVALGTGETGTASEKVLSAAKKLHVESDQLKRELDGFMAGIRAA